LKLTLHQNNQIICGGKVIAGTGYFVEPTLLTVRGIDDPLFIEETFGPVVDVIAFESDEELISMMKKGFKKLRYIHMTEQLENIRE